VLATYYAHSSLVAYSELQKFNAPVWNDKFAAATPNSTLHPSVTGAESLIRWMGVPLFINSSSTTPDGVYITGDLVNGKCALLVHMSSAVYADLMLDGTGAAVYNHQTCKFM
jgi:hypothetical protein